MSAARRGVRAIAENGGRSDRTPGRHRAEEDPTIRRLWAAMTQVVDDGLAEHRRDRERRRVVGLALEHLEAVVLPVDVVQRERCDLTAAHAVGDEQEEDRVVPPTGGRASIDSREHPVDLRPEIERGIAESRQTWG